MSKILLIDDDEQFKNSFQIEAQAQGLKLVYRRSLAGLQEVMSSHHKQINAIILDIKCLITDNQSKESEDFIGAATKYLDENFPGFPRLILTGDDDAFDGFRKFSASEDIYKKTPDGIASVLVKLNFYVKNSEFLQIKRNYTDVFALFDQGHYNDITENTLISVLKSIEEKDYSKFRGIISNVRALQETIYKTISNKNNLVVPVDKFRGNGMVKFNDLMNHLNGYPDRSFKPTKTVYHNSVVYNISNSIYWVCGSLIHADPSETYLISNYTVKSMIYGLVELFLWSKKYL